MKHLEPVYGSISKDEGGIAFVRYERQLPHAPEVVWNLITDPESRLGFFSQADLQIGGEVSIQFSETYSETYTITKLEANALLEFVNNETQGHPAKYYTDTIEITGEGSGSRLVFNTPIGPMGEAQIRIAEGWHIWVDNVRLILDHADVTRAELDATQFEREALISEPYIRQLEELYPGWPGGSDQ